MILRQRPCGFHSLLHHEDGPEHHPAQISLRYGHHIFSYIGLQIPVHLEVK